MDDFDFALGGEFERQMMHWLWETNNNRRTSFCKPDAYDVDFDIFYEAKCTRPYYDKDPDKYSDAVDLGSGMPVNQFNRYVKVVNNGHRVIMVHGMTHGRYKGKVFITELNETLIKKVRHSFIGNTVYWYYDDLKLNETYTWNIKLNNNTFIT